MPKIKKQKINQLFKDLGFDDIEVFKDMDKTELKVFLKDIGFTTKEVREIISEF